MPELPKLESGERIQDCLVGIANNLGDCDDAADLAEIVSMLDRMENKPTQTLLEKHNL